MGPEAFGGSRGGRERLLGLLQARADRADPVGFITRCLGEHLWSAQAKIARAVAAHRHVAVPSCHGSGKSFAAARVMAWWIAAHPPGEAFVVSTAPTANQVRSILWRELHAAHAKGSLPGRLNQTEWWLDGALVGIGHKPADWSPAAFQGIHAKAVLVVIDEASGVPEAIFTAAETLATTPASRILAIGNPDDPGSAFARACRPNSGWHVIPIDAFATPNFTEEEIPKDLSPLLVSPQWVSERRARWGEGSALWEAKVRGRFPDAADDALIPLSWVERARERGAATPPEPGAPVVLGVDVARSGSAETVLLALQGRHARVVEAYRGRETMETAGRVARAIRELGASEARVDVVGVGAGVVDRLAELSQPVRGLHAGAASTDPAGYVNARAQWYWALREALDPASPSLDLDPSDEVLAEQLASIRHHIDSRGRVVIESKEQMRARGLPSPDRADALMLASAVVPEPERTYVIVQEQERVRISPF